MKKRYIAMMSLVMGLMLLGECPECNNIVCQCQKEPAYEKVEFAEPVYAAEKELTVEEMIIEKCNTYEVDSILALAICRLETGNFTSDAYIYGNNVGGISESEVPVSFDSLEEGVEAFVRNLKVNYYNEGLNDVDEIAGKYCPVNEKQWAETVKALMEEMEA
ncbi:MAG: glucosaminidase domain-containing protein [Emergencia sp.]